jgi:NAD-dependent deacetylase
VVEPAASFPRLAKHAGAALVILNNQETPLDDIADLVIRQPIGPTMLALLRHLPG